MVIMRSSGPSPGGNVVPLIDRYLGSTCVPAERMAEAVLLRGIAVRLTALAASDSATADENRKLREQLELTKRELDRLRLRIIPPAE
jgi:hypothetical protein